MTGADIHEFIRLEGKEAQEVRADFEQILKEVRDEKRKLAQAALSAGKMPQMVFCKFCGARNKSDQMKCGNCGALL
jgi:hypothetical protein